MCLNHSLDPSYALMINSASLGMKTVEKGKVAYLICHCGIRVIYAIDERNLLSATLIGHKCDQSSWYWKNKSKIPHAYRRQSPLEEKKSTNKNGSLCVFTLQQYVYLWCNVPRFNFFYLILSLCFIIKHRLYYRDNAL